MISSKKFTKDSIIIGAALFSMFFGAGNMIFPPYLGLKSGKEWVWGFLSYFIADIVLAIVAVIAINKSGGHKRLFEPLGNAAGEIAMFAIILCIGPLITIPRTAATTYELAIQPLNPNFNMLVFYIIFFAVVFLLCFKKNAVVDIVGKILTPLLFIGLVFIIIIGIINLSGQINIPARTNGVISDGIKAGYQSMDVLAAVIFSVLIISTVKERGYICQKDKFKVTALSGVISGAGLMLIYLGLTYLGACVAPQYDMHIHRTELLVNLIGRILPGNFGVIVFAVIAGLACLSTAVALTSAVCEFLYEKANKKIRYEWIVALICVFDALISLLGVEGLISFAAPILDAVYPPILVVVFLSLVNKFIGKWTYRLSAITSFIIAVLCLFPSINHFLNYEIYIPLSEYSLIWVVPTLTIGLIGFIIDRAENKKAVKYAGVK